MAFPTTKRQICGAWVGLLSHFMLCPLIFYYDYLKNSNLLLLIGVILYILLGGYPPFIDDNQRRLFRKIRKGDYEFHDEYWGTVSDDAKNLISSLLVVNSRSRLTAKEALQSNWIAVATDDALSKHDMGLNLVELRKFNGRRKFRAAVASVIAVNKLVNFLVFDTFQPGMVPKW